MKVEVPEFYNVEFSEEESKTLDEAVQILNSIINSMVELKKDWLRVNYNDGEYCNSYCKEELVKLRNTLHNVNPGVDYNYILQNTQV